jgi:hypothetical protein
MILLDVQVAAPEGFSMLISSRLAPFPGIALRERNIYSFPSTLKFYNFVHLNYATISVMGQ